MYSVNAKFGLAPDSKYSLPKTVDFLLAEIQKNRSIPYEVGFCIDTVEIFDPQRAVFGNWPIDPPLALPTVKFAKYLAL